MNRKKLREVVELVVWEGSVILLAAYISMLLIGAAHGIAPSFFPWAPGWWAMVLISTVVYAVRRLWRRWRQRPEVPS